MTSGIQRLLDLVKQELAAADSRLEIGGLPPTDPRLVWWKLSDENVRVVAVFDETPRERVELERRLAAVAESFSETIRQRVGNLGSLVPSAGPPPDSVQARLDAELLGLAERAGARFAVVFDLSSPVLWGASLRAESERATRAAAESPNDEHLSEWIDTLRDGYPDELRASHKHVVRLEIEGQACLVRMFGGLYVLALSFDEALSEPTAVGSILHAAGTIERLVLSLPPVDPPPMGKRMRVRPRLV